MADHDEPHADPSPAPETIPTVPETTVDFNGDDALVETIPRTGPAEVA